MASSRAGGKADPGHATAAMSFLSEAQLSAATALHEPGLSSSASAAALLQHTPSEFVELVAEIAGIPAELFLERREQEQHEPDRLDEERRENMGGGLGGGLASLQGPVEFRHSSQFEDARKLTPPKSSIRKWTSF